MRGQSPFRTPRDLRFRRDEICFLYLYHRPTDQTPACRRRRRRRRHLPLRPTPPRTPPPHLHSSPHTEHIPLTHNKSHSVYLPPSHVVISPTKKLKKTILTTGRVVFTRATATATATATGSDEGHIINYVEGRLTTTDRAESLGGVCAVVAANGNTRRDPVSADGTHAMAAGEMNREQRETAEAERRVSPVRVRV